MILFNIVYKLAILAAAQPSRYVLMRQFFRAAAAFTDNGRKM
jgi:hypothetical protein